MTAGQGAGAGAEAGEGQGQGQSPEGGPGLEGPDLTLEDLGPSLDLDLGQDQNQEGPGRSQEGLSQDLDQKVQEDQWKKMMENNLLKLKIMKNLIERKMDKIKIMG